MFNKIIFIFTPDVTPVTYAPRNKSYVSFTGVTFTKLKLASPHKV